VTVLASVSDPDGRLIELTAERWAHIEARHPELRRLQAEVLKAVSAPARTHQGRRANEQWFYLEGVGPSRWLKVAVAYEEKRGWITTAFGQRTLP
jgi:hypothetical protein